MCALLAAVASYELMHAVGGEQWELLPAMPVLAAAMTGALGAPMLGIAPIWLLAGIFAVILYGFVMAIATHGREKQLGFATLAAGILSATAAARGLRLPRAFALRLARAGHSAAGGRLHVATPARIFTGRALGRHKLCPHVSPNKTVEGSVGGFIGSVVGMIIWHLAVKAYR